MSPKTIQEDLKVLRNLESIRDTIIETIKANERCINQNPSQHNCGLCQSCIKRNKETLNKIFGMVKFYSKEG